MKAVSKYWAIMSTQFQTSLAYPAEILGRSLILLPFMWIFYQLWRVTYASAGTATINGLSLSNTMWYLVLTETIELSHPRPGLVISESVKDGSIAYTLNKPYDFLLYHFSNAMGETLFRGAINILIGSTIVWWLVGAVPNPLSWLLVIPTMVGAWTLNFCISAFIGLAAFSIEDISALQWIYQKLAFVLGGLLIPLDFYPGWLQAICKTLPFAAISYEPARLFIAPTMTRFLIVFGMQAAWIVGIGLLLTIVYRRGLRQLAVNGG